MLPWYNSPANIRGLSQQNISQSLQPSLQGLKSSTKFNDSQKIPTDPWNILQVYPKIQYDSGFPSNRWLQVRGLGLQVWGVPSFLGPLTSPPVTACSIADNVATMRASGTTIRPLRKCSTLQRAGQAPKRCQCLEKT